MAKLGAAEVKAAIQSILKFIQKNYGRGEIFEADYNRLQEQLNILRDQKVPGVTSIAKKIRDWALFPEEKANKAAAKSAYNELRALLSGKGTTAKAEPVVSKAEPVKPKPAPKKTIDESVDDDIKAAVATIQAKKKDAAPAAKAPAKAPAPKKEGPKPIVVKKDTKPKDPQAPVIRLTKGFNRSPDGKVVVLRTANSIHTKDLSKDNEPFRVVRFKGQVRGENKNPVVAFIEENRDKPGFWDGLIEAVKKTPHTTYVPKITVTKNGEVAFKNLVWNKAGKPGSFTPPKGEGAKEFLQVAEGVAKDWYQKKNPLLRVEKQISTKTPFRVGAKSSAKTSTVSQASKDLDDMVKAATDAPDVKSPDAPGAQVPQSFLQKHWPKMALGGLLSIPAMGVIGGLTGDSEAELDQAMLLEQQAQEHASRQRMEQLKQVQQLMQILKTMAQVQGMTQPQQVQAQGSDLGQVLGLLGSLG